MKKHIPCCLIAALLAACGGGGAGNGSGNATPPPVTTAPTTPATPVTSEPAPAPAPPVAAPHNSLFAFDGLARGIVAFATPLPSSVAAPPAPTLLPVPYATSILAKIAYDEAHDVLYATTADGIAVYEKASVSHDTPPTRLLSLDSTEIHGYRDLYYDKEHDVLYLETGSSTQPLILAFAKPSELKGKVRPTRTIPYFNAEGGFAIDTKRNILYATRSLGDPLGGAIVYAMSGIDTFDAPDAFNHPNANTKHPASSSFSVGGRAAYGLELDSARDRLYYITDEGLHYLDGASHAALSTAGSGFPVPVRLSLRMVQDLAGTIAYDAASDQLYVLNAGKLHGIDGASKLTAQSGMNVRTFALPAGMALTTIALP